METIRPFPEEVARSGIRRAGENLGLETFREHFLKHYGDKKLVIEAEILARAFELQGGITTPGILDMVVTPEMIDAAGKSMLTELQDNGLLQR